MSKTTPQAGDSLTHKLNKLRTAADAIERLATEYHSAIRPIREALQAVADVPLRERAGWVDAVSALARGLSENGFAEMPGNLETAKRWDRQFDAGEPGHAFAGRAFCHVLAAAIADGSAPSEFFSTLDQHSFTTGAATLEVCAVLSHLLHVHTERTAPGFTRRYGAILAEVGIDSETLRHRLARCELTLSSEADDAVRDWDECSTGIPCYHANICPTADLPECEAKQREEESLHNETGSGLVLPEPKPDGTNPFHVIKWDLFTAFVAARYLTQERQQRVRALGRKMRTEELNGVRLLHWEDDVDHSSVEKALASRLFNTWSKALREARRLCAAFRIPFDVHDPLLRAAEVKMNDLDNVIRGVASDKEVDGWTDLENRLSDLGDSTTPVTANKDAGGPSRTNPPTAPLPPLEGTEPTAGEKLPNELDCSKPEKPEGTGELPTRKLTGVVSLNVLRATLEMMGFPDWRKRFESWPEVPSLRLRCVELFPGQPFSSATVELLIAWFQERGLTPDQARHLPLSEAVGRLSAHQTARSGATSQIDAPPTQSNPSLLDQAKQFVDERDREEEARRVAMRLMPHILFPPNSPFGNLTGVADKTPDTATPVGTQQGEWEEQPTKRRFTRDEAERRVANIIGNTPLDQRRKLTVRALNRATGVSLGMISKLDSWVKLQDEKAGAVRSVPLTDDIHAVLHDTSAEAIDPAEAVAEAEVLSKLLAYASTDAERVRFEEMTPGERWQVLELLKEQANDARRDQRRPRRKSDRS